MALQRLLTSLPIDLDVSHQAICEAVATYLSHGGDPPTAREKALISAIAAALLSVLTED